MEEVVTNAAQLLLNYGVLGIAVVFLAFYLLKKDKDHTQERASLTASIKDQNEKMIEAFDKNTSVLSEVKAIINTIRTQ